jgi:hypothetical protein
MPHRGRRPATPFRETNRYVRGRLLAVLRDAPADAWSVLDGEALAIAPERVDRAARELLDEGIIDLAVDGEGRPTARLASA